MMEKRCSRCLSTVSVYEISPLVRYCLKCVKLLNLNISLGQEVPTALYHNAKREQDRRDAGQSAFTKRNDDINNSVKSETPKLKSEKTT